jgi:prefoldin subunit 5
MSYPPHTNLGQTNQLLRRTARRIKVLDLHISRSLESNNIFERDIQNMSDSVDTLQALKKEVKNLKQLLDSILKGNKKSYAPKRQERSSPYFQGVYSTMIEEVRKHIYTLNTMLRNLDLYINMLENKNRNSIANAAAAHVEQIADHIKDMTNQNENTGWASSETSALVSTPVTPHYIPPQPLLSSRPDLIFASAALLLALIKRRWQGN